MSAAVVQVGNHVYQAGDRFDQGNRRRAERGVRIAQPGPGHRNVAADDGVEGSEQTQEQYGELERLAAGVELKCAAAHPRHRGL